MVFPGKQAQADDDGKGAVVCGGGERFRGTTKGTKLQLSPVTTWVTWDVN